MMVLFLIPNYSHYSDFPKNPHHFACNVQRNHKNSDIKSSLDMHKSS
jgi:hypothetical protein